MNSPPEAKPSPLPSFRLVGAMCLAEAAGMLGVFAFPALLPHFLKLWDLSNSQAGWINGIYFVGYTAAVPLLTSLTDRVDARKIYLFSCALGALANLGFALLTTGFWTALFFRAISGLGLAGTFIPGLKAIIDRLELHAHPRAISFYTACFGLGMSGSFYFTGEMFRWLGWKEAFGFGAAGSLLALALAFLVLKPQSTPRPPGSAARRPIFDFRAVWRNRDARAYILAYMCHMWEMFAARSWMVAFLSFTITLQATGADFIAPTTVMAAAGVGGMAASIAGGELAVRLGRRRVVAAFMAVSFILALTIGFSSRAPYNVVVFLCILYTLFFQGDSAAIHAGVITSADPDRRGGAMALQSLGGFAAASLGSVFTGFVLDVSGGGSTPLSWGVTFAAMGAAAALGPICLYRRRRSLRGGST
ncbi:MAG: MFS transporter [Desulfobacterales bacterium]|nr:MFS transporter [Desulfobacterales bacterium]